MERAGLPTVLVSALSPLAQSVGANRIVRGRAVSHPFGDPGLVPAEERRYRKRLVEQAITALQTAVDRSTIFEGNE